MNLFAGISRLPLLERLTERTYDLLVIGGGVTGAGIALDAAARGMRVALIEQQDFAAGTSSRSTKLIHGGLRYLKQLEIKLVQEVGSERAIVHRLAPHLVIAEPMLLPLIQGGTYGRLATSFGLWVYDVLAGVRPEDQRRMLSKADTLRQEPLLREPDLLGGGLYAEYRTDDARLTIEILKTASSFGADCINYLRASEFVYTDGRISAVRCEDRLLGGTHTIQARQVVSAAGPWVDELRKLNQSMNRKRLHLTKGVHIVVPRTRMPLRQSVYFDMPDGRMIFAIPRGRTTYIGTTDTDYQGDPAHPRTELPDVAYLLDGANRMFPSVQLTLADVESSWAGLRPLIHEEGKSASELSRKDEIFVSESGLISIAGGKLTGYRKMAERVVNRVAQRLGGTWERCRTAQITLCGGEFSDPEEIRTLIRQTAERLAPCGMGEPEAAYLVHTFGTQTDLILEHFFAEGNLSPRGLVLAELWFCLEYEMTHTVLDFFNRRTGRVYFDIHSVRQWQDTVLAAMGRALNWSPERSTRERSGLEQALEEASVFPEQIPQAAREAAHGAA
jgi:glycerol-3-phosphate dehydrogenase